jgi:hypothetical protein
MANAAVQSEVSSVLFHEWGPIVRTSLEREQLSKMFRTFRVQERAGLSATTANLCIRLSAHSTPSEDGCTKRHRERQCCLNVRRRVLDGSFNLYAFRRTRTYPFLTILFFRARAET